MDESSQGIRFEIDGDWTAGDMGEMLLATSDLYDLRLFLETLSDERKGLERYYLDEFDRLPRSFFRRRHMFPFRSSTH